LEPQVFEFLGSEPEHEISRKPPPVPFDRFVQYFGLYTIKQCQVVIQQDSLAPQEIYAVLDLFHRDDGVFGHEHTFVFSKFYLHAEKLPP
jgi:hypothetical protein